MRPIRMILSVLTAAAVCLTFRPSSGWADGAPASAVPAEAQAEAPAFEFGNCKAAAVYECSTGTLLAGKNEHQPVPIGHLAKLMTFLLAAEKISAGVLSLDDTAVCSHNANSQQGSQIWLDVGEKITVDDLLRSVSVGNANDAAVCLSEMLYGNSDDYISAADHQAKSLDMTDTSFCDVTGMSKDTVSSASDMCRLCSRLVKLEDFSAYFTTWMDNVRDGKAELVSRNRLIRSYKGIKGFKVGYTEASGECAAVCAKRGEMTVCAVVLGAPDEDSMLGLTSSLLDRAFSAFEVYTPEVPEEALKGVKVSHGVKTDCPAEIPGLSPVIITKGSYRSVSCEFECSDSLNAPFEKGTVIGRIVFKLNDKDIISEDICTSETVDEVDMSFCLKRVLFNLLNF